MLEHLSRRLRWAGTEVSSPASTAECRTSFYGILRCITNIRKVWAGPSPFPFVYVDLCSPLLLKALFSLKRDAAFLCLGRQRSPSFNLLSRDPSIFGVCSNVAFLIASLFARFLLSLRAIFPLPHSASGACNLPFLSAVNSLGQACLRCSNWTAPF